MIIYHPFFDVYHGVFRILQLLEVMPNKRCDFDRLRILDFYLLFPSLLKDVSFPMEIISHKKKFTNYYKTYESIKDPYRLFLQLESFQDFSIRLLIALDFIKSEEYKNGIISRTEKSIPLSLAEDLDIARQDNDEVISFLSGPFFEIEFYGKKGLKARTKLMEHRYDVS